MKQSFRILLVEDNQDDVELLQIQLKKLDLEFNLDVVDQKNTLIEYLEEQHPDLIISDYNLPGFTGIEALELVREHDEELPFILVSGFIGEEKAVDAMRKGASDYVLKDNLERLMPAVKREIIHYQEQKKTEKERDQALLVLKERVKEQKCLYNISRLDDQILNIKKLLQTAVKYIPAGLKYPEIAEAAIEYKGEIYQTPDYAETEWLLTGSSDKTLNDVLKVNVVYLEEGPGFGIDPFISEELDLIDSVIDILSLKINRILDQQELEKKRKLLEKAYNLAEIGNWEYIVEESKLYLSPKTKEIFEVPDDFDCNLETIINFFKKGNDRETIRHNLKLAIEEGKKCDVELKIITAKNNERWVRHIGEPEFIDGTCVRLYGAFQNINSRKQAEEKVYKSEQRFKSLVQEGSDLISIIDAEGNYQYVSPSTQREKSLGMVQDEFDGLNCFDFMHEEDRERVREIIAELKPNERKEIAAYRFRNPKGGWRWLETTITNLKDTPGVNGYVANSKDVTERIDQERKLRDIIENSTNLFYRHDVNHVITYISPQTEEFLGCSPEEAKKRWTEFATNHPANKIGFQKTLKAIETGVPQDPYELQLQKINGEKIWVRVNESPVVENGETVAMVGSLTDITARKDYEEKLEDLSLVASKTTDIIIITDAEERITWVNKAYEKLTGYTLEESLGKVPGDFLQGPETNPETVKRITIAVDSRQSVQETILNYAKDGTTYWLDMKIDPIFEDGNCTGFIAIERDVTEKRNAYEKLVTTEKKLREIVEHSTNLFYKHDVDHQLEYVSPQSYEFVGLKPDEAMKKWTDLITDHPVNKIGIKKTKKAIKTGKPQGPYELQFRHANGSVVWARVHEAPVVENGKTVAMVGSLTDISAQKKYEEKLEELSQIAAKTTDLIFVADRDHRITWVNYAFEKSIGYSLEESTGKMPSELFFSPETNKKTLLRINQKMEKNETVKETIQIETKFGEKKWMDITIDSIFDEEKNFNRYITIQKDVTEKIEKEKALQESLERYDIVTKATSDTIWDADLQTDTINYNSNIYDVFGYSEQEVQNSGEWWLSKIHPEDRERVDKEFKTTELAQKDRVHSEYRFQCADGSYKYVNDRAFIIDDENGKPVRMIGAMQDITKQKEENMWLKILESAIANTNESIAILNAKGEYSSYREIIYVNDAFEKMTGYSKDEVLGESLLNYMGNQTNPQAVADVLHSLDKGEACQIESTYVRKSGTEYWAHVSFAPVMNSNGSYSHWVVVGRDVTTRKKRESELQESLQEKETLLMEVHHRVKNNLAVVSGMMQLQAMKEQDDSLQKKLYDSVTRIRTMATIHEVIYESGSFSKLDFGKNLKKLVSTIIETMQDEHEITANFMTEETHLNVNQAIPASLIINEIVTNCIKHAFVGSKNKRLNVELREIENRVKISISDNGKGLPEGFDKNHTSSLGLQLISILSNQMNAKYEYYASEGGGTTFEIEFEKSTVKGMGNVHLS